MELMELINTLNEILNNNINKQNELIDKISTLPKGHINILNRSNKQYYYLTYRDGTKICNKYIGIVGKCDINDILKMLTERQRCKNELKELKNEEKLIKKAIKQ